MNIFTRDEMHTTSKVIQQNAAQRFPSYTLASMWEPFVVATFRPCEQALSSWERLKQVHVGHQFSFLYIYPLETIWKVDERDSGYIIGSSPTVTKGVACECYSIVDGRGVAYGLMLRPFGVNERSAFIQWLSFRLLKLASFLWIFSTTMIVRSRMEWSGWQKCLATGLSVRRCCISDLWPVNRTRSAFSVSPTYWVAHFLHSMT